MEREYERERERDRQTDRKSERERMKERQRHRETKRLRERERHYLDINNLASRDIFRHDDSELLFPGQTETLGRLSREVLKGDNSHSHQVTAMDSLVALCYHRFHALHKNTKMTRHHKANRLVPNPLTQLIPIVPSYYDYNRFHSLHKNIKITRHRKANRLVSNPLTQLLPLCLHFMTKNKNVT